MEILYTIFLIFLLIILIIGMIRIILKPYDGFLGLLSDLFLIDLIGDGIGCIFSALGDLFSDGDFD